MFRKAERKQVKLKIGLSAPSGAGKTYSALLIAYGICGDWEKVAVIDTENRSAELYSDLGGYSVCPIVPPFTPQKYIQAIHEAVAAGFEVLIIDSLSHAWSGEGGLLEMKDKAASNSKSGNSFTAWRDISPEHNRLVNAILQSNIDVIVTTRAKSDYVVSNDNGKTTVKKVGLAPVFREGLEYELTTFFDLSQDHTATASKDRTKLFDGIDFVPTVETGKSLAAWRDGGAVVVFATDEQKEMLITLGSKLEDVAQYFNVGVDSLTYEQAQWAIDKKTQSNQKKQQAQVGDSKAPSPLPANQTDSGNVPPPSPQPEGSIQSDTTQQSDAKPGVQTRTILNLIEGTVYTLDSVNAWIENKFGKLISIDSLSPNNFNYMYDYFEKAIKGGGNG